MINKCTVAGTLACLAFLLHSSSIETHAEMQVQSLQAAKYQQPLSDDLRVVLLGTGVGPPVRLDQFGMSTLIEAAGTRPSSTRVAAIRSA
jgi:hypothetical protein